MTILDNIDAILASMKMSRSVLERKAGIGRQSVEKWDKSIPRLDMILRVAEVLDVSLNRLLEGTDLQTKKADTPEGVGLSNKERELIRRLREHPERLDALLAILPE